MLLELLKNYADMINSATRMNQRSATAMARTMLIQAGMEPAADMVSKLSEQMIAAQDAHYEMMRRMVQAEVEMTVARMGALSPAGAAAEEESAEETAPEVEEPVTELRVVEQPDVSEPDPEATGAAANVTELQPNRDTLAPAPVADEAVVEQEAPEPEVAAAKAPAARKATARKTTPRKTTARKTTARKSTTTRSAKKASSSGDSAGSPTDNS